MGEVTPSGLVRDDASRSISSCPFFLQSNIRRRTLAALLDSRIGSQLTADYLDSTNEEENVIAPARLTFTFIRVIRAIRGLNLKCFQL